MLGDYIFKSINATVGRDCQDNRDSITLSLTFFHLMKLRLGAILSTVDHCLWNALGPPLLEVLLGVGNEEVK